MHFDNMMRTRENIDTGEQNLYMKGSCFCKLKNLSYWRTSNEDVHVLMMLVKQNKTNTQRKC